MHPINLFRRLWRYACVDSCFRVFRNILANDGIRCQYSWILDFRSVSSISFFSSFCTSESLLRGFFSSRVIVTSENLPWFQQIELYVLHRAISRSSNNPLSSNSFAIRNPLHPEQETNYSGKMISNQPRYFSAASPGSID